MKENKLRDFALLSMAAVVMLFAAVLDWPLTAWARKGAMDCNKCSGSGRVKGDGNG